MEIQPLSLQTHLIIMEVDLALVKIMEVQSHQLIIIAMAVREIQVEEEEEAAMHPQIVHPAITRLK